MYNHIPIFSQECLHESVTQRKSLALINGRESFTTETHRGCASESTSSMCAVPPDNGLCLGQRCSHFQLPHTGKIHTLTISTCDLDKHTGSILRHGCATASLASELLSRHSKYKTCLWVQPWRSPTRPELISCFARLVSCENVHR